MKYAFTSTSPSSDGSTLMASPEAAYSVPESPSIQPTVDHQSSSFRCVARKVFKRNSQTPSLATRSGFQAERLNLNAFSRSESKLCFNV